jgi:hypothetical protein
MKNKNVKRRMYYWKHSYPYYRRESKAEWIQREMESRYASFHSLTHSSAQLSLRLTLLTIKINL